jgi:hypothetical protein
MALVGLSDMATKYTEILYKEDKKILYQWSHKLKSKLKTIHVFMGRFYTPWLDIGRKTVARVGSLIHL